MNTDKPQRTTLGRLGAALAGILLVSGAAAAESDTSATEEPYIEEIIVTAEMREESILEVPATMSAFSKKMIEELGMANNADIEALTPGLQMGEDGDVNHSSLRGIWTQNARETNADLAVATYIDGVYTVDSFGISPDLFDLERVEIARGPQGTQHGRNSIGGSISYVNKRPTTTWDTEMMLQLTDQVTQRWNVAFGGPLNDAVSFRVTGSYYEGDGAQENLGTGGDYDAPDRRSIAPQLRFKTDRVDVNLRYQYVRDTGVPDVHIMLNEPNRNDPETSPEWYQYDVPVPSLANCPYDGAAQAEAWKAEHGYYPQPEEFWTPLCTDPEDKILANRDGMTDSTSDRFTLSADWHITDRLTLRYVFGDSKSDTVQAADDDGTSRVPDANDPFVAADAPVMFIDAQWRYHFNSEETSHELQLISNLDGPFDFIIGAYAYNNDNRFQYDNYDYTPLSGHNVMTWSRFANVDELAQAVGFADCQAYHDFWNPLWQGWEQSFEYTCPETNDHTNWHSYFNPATMDTRAVFANAEYQLNENWRFAGGLRWTEDEKSLRVEGHILFDMSQWLGVNANLPLRLNLQTYWEGLERHPRAWDDTTGHISVEYTPSGSDVMYYGRISTGYRAGGFERSETTLQTHFKKETLINYEAGVKGMFVDNRLQLTAAGFYNDYADFQFMAVQEVDVFFAPAGETNKVYASYTANINGTRIWGAELEATYYVDSRLRLSGFYAYLDSEIGPHVYPVGGPNSEYVEVLEWYADGGVQTQLLPKIIDVTGNQLPQQPTHKGALVAQYAMPVQNGTLQFLTALSYVGKRYIEIGNQPEYRLPGHARWDIRSTWVSPEDKWSVTAYVQNVLDKVNIREALARFGGSICCMRKNMGRLTPPRRIGLEVRYKL